MTCADLRRAVTSRDAHAGVLLAERPEGLPSDAQPVGMKVYFHEALVVLHHDRTEASAAAWLGFVLRAVALLARVHHAGASSRLDRSGVRVAVQRIESAITHMRPLRACVTGAEKELAKLDQHSRVMEAEIRAALGELALLVAA